MLDVAARGRSLRTIGSDLQPVAIDIVRDPGPARPGARAKQWRLQINDRENWS